jgi:hypothetical protein
MDDVRVEPLAIADPLALPELARELGLRWLVWDAFVAGKRRVDVHPLFLSERAHVEAVDVAKRAAALVFAAGDRAAADPAERALYRLHPDVERLAEAARRAGDMGGVARVDLLLREDGRFVACEVNADCPGGYNETLALPRLARAAGLRRGHDPTRAATMLADRLATMANGGMIALTYATAWAEDLQVVALLERLLRERGARAERVPPTALDPSRFSVLYRFYPLEDMAGMRVVEPLARATERGELASMSSFANIHAQSKLAMARAFAHDPESARAVFPETIPFADVEREGWVVKRDLSRVGDHVLVGPMIEEWRDVLDDVTELQREGDVWIAQRYVPQRSIATPWGPRLLTLGVYLLDGAFAGYYARLSEASLCTHDALVLPTFVEAA